MALLLATGAAWYWTSRQTVRYISQGTLQLVEGRTALTGGIEGNRRATSLEVLVRSATQILRSRSIIGAVVDSMPLGFRVVPAGFPASTVSAVTVADTTPPGALHLSFVENGWRTDRDSMVLHRYDERATIGGVSFAVGRQPEAIESGTVLVLSRDQAIDRMLLQLFVSDREQTSLIDLRLTADNPVVVVEALRTLMEVYKDSDAKTLQQQAIKRREFIAQQLEATNARLSVAEQNQGAFRGRQQAYSAEQKFAGKQAEMAVLNAKRQELTSELGMATDLSTRLTSSDAGTRADGMRMLPSTSTAAAPAIAALYAELTTRETTRAEMTTGPRALSLRSADVLRADTLIAATQRRLVAAVQAHAQVLSTRLATLDAQRVAVQRELEINPTTQANETMLAQSADALREQASALRAEYQRAQIAEAAEVGQVEIVDPPVRAIPLRTPATRVILFAGFLGLLAGAGVLVGREMMDRTIRTRATIEQGLRVPLLATIPRIESPKKASAGVKRQQVALTTVKDVRSGGAEAFRQLRTNLLFTAEHDAVRCILVTSAREGEGKTSVAVNLAVSFAQQQLKVLLIDCDLVRSRLAGLMNRARTPGLQQVLLENLPPDEAVQPTDIPGLSLLAAGSDGGTPFDAAGTERFRAVLRYFAVTYDIVLLDSAPLLAVADSAAMSVLADGVVMVMRAGSTSLEEAEEAMRHLDTVQANVVGAVLNDVDGCLRGSGHSYYYGYGSRYTSASV